VVVNEAANSRIPLNRRVQHGVDAVIQLTTMGASREMGQPARWITKVLHERLDASAERACGTIAHFTSPTYAVH